MRQRGPSLSSLNCRSGCNEYQLGQGQSLYCVLEHPLPPCSGLPRNIPSVSWPNTSTTIQLTLHQLQATKVKRIRTVSAEAKSPPNYATLLTWYVVNLPSSRWVYTSRGSRPATLGVTSGSRSRSREIPPDRPDCPWEGWAGATPSCATGGEPGIAVFGIPKLAACIDCAMA